MPSLILIKSPGATSTNQSYQLTGQHVLGREESCEIVVPNHAVSRKHAQIVKRGSGQFYVEDLKSRNGTTVNNEPVTEARLLKHDDRIKICDFLYRFHDETVANRQPLSSAYLAPPEEPPLEGSQSTIEHAFPTRMADRLLDALPTERLRALLDISTALSRTMDYDKLMSAIAERVLDVFRQADRCFVILKEDEMLVPKVVKARRSAGADDDQRFSRTIVRRCLQTNEAYLSEDASSDQNLGAAMSVAEFRIRSVMCVPLTSPDGVPMGALQIDTQDRTKKFKTSDLELLAIVANLAAVAVEKAHLASLAMAEENQRKEIELAKKVQLGFLPQKTPPLKGYEFYHFYSAAKTVGGDYYDYILLPDKRLAVVLGDVAGKGVPASLLMAKLSSEVRYCLVTEPDPALAVRLLNEQLILGGIDDRFVTFAAVIIDGAKHTATIVNAGHINPILYRNGKMTQAISSDESGIPLGIMSGFEYVSVERRLEPGDNLLIFSDGVTDAMDPSGIMFDMSGVQRVLEGDGFDRPARIGDRVVRSVQTHAAGRDQNDDIAFVCFGRLLDHFRVVTNDTGSMYPTKGAA